MKIRKSLELEWLGLIVPLLFVVLVLGGYLANVYKTTQLDFETPLKAEVIRVVGIFVPPVGVVLGYVTFEEEEGK